MVSPERLLEVSDMGDPQSRMKDWISEYMERTHATKATLENLDNENLTEREIAQKLIEMDIEDIKVIPSNSPNADVSDHYGFFYLKYFGLPDEVVRVGERNAYHVGRMVAEAFDTLYPTQLLQYRSRYEGKYKRKIEKWYKSLSEGSLSPAEFTRIFLIGQTCPTFMTYASTFRFRNSSELYRLIKRAEESKK